MTKIVKVIGREVLDSRGKPTVEAEVVLANGIKGRGIAPSGASTGKFEAHELRDFEGKRYLGKGVLKAVSNVNSIICAALKGMNVNNLYGIDAAMLELDGTENKSVLGANAILAVSIACAKAAAKAKNMPLYRYLGGISATTLPVPMMNILNGGAHAGNNVDVQEFMIMPIGAETFSEGLRWCSEVYANLGAILRKRSLSVAVGDEGGYAPNLSGDEETLELIIEAVESCGYQMTKDFVIAIDAAASEWKSTKGCGYYHLPKSGKEYTGDELIRYWKELSDKYPIASIEDPLDEEDWDSWQSITRELGGKVQLVGDDLFVTNPKRLNKGFALECGNSILIKLNQIGTVSETIETIKLAKRRGYSVIVSHRSGETEDTTIADLAVALNAGQIKTGAPARSERVAKYNRLLRIEENLKEQSYYPTNQALYLKR